MRAGAKLLYLLFCSSCSVETLNFVWRSEQVNGYKFKDWMIIEYQVLKSPSFRYPGIYGQKCKIHLSAEGRAAKLENGVVKNYSMLLEIYLELRTTVDKLVLIELLSGTKDFN